MEQQGIQIYIAVGFRFIQVFGVRIPNAVKVFRYRQIVVMSRFRLRDAALYTLAQYCVFFNLPV